MAVLTPDERARHNKDLYLRRTYGISIAEFEAIVEFQGGLCPVCGKELGEDMTVDHDHIAMIVRGILHRYCNHKQVGRHRDWKALMRVVNYLKNPPAFRVLGSGHKQVPKKRRRRRKRT